MNLPYPFSIPIRDSSLAEPSLQNINSFMASIGHRNEEIRLLSPPATVSSNSNRPNRLSHAPIRWETRPFDTHNSNSNSSASNCNTIPTPFCWVSSHSHLAAPAHAILRKHPSAYIIFFEDDNTYEEYCLDQFPHAHVEIGPARLLSQSLPFPSTLHINGYDATYRGDPAECLYLRWIHQQFKIISNLSNAHQLERFALFIRYDLETDAPDSIFDRTSRLDCLPTL